MLFARSERCHPRRVKRLKTQCLAGSQVVVCKIHQPPFLVPAALFPTISFYLLGVGLAIFLPIVRVRPAPLPWTLQADLLINRIGGDLLPVIIGAALALAGDCTPVVADGKEKAEKLAASSGKSGPSSGGSRREWKGFILSGSALKPGGASQKIQRGNDRVFTPSLPIGLLLLLLATTDSMTSSLSASCPERRHDYVE